MKAFSMVNGSILDGIPPLFPVDFFNLSADIPYSKTFLSKKNFSRSHFLPSTSALLNETSFADLKLAWNEEGLLVQVFARKPFEESFYPHFSGGDSLELFFDTRDLKTAGFAGRFCHHFVVLISEIQGIRALEMTRFRTEDAHPLCESQEIHIETKYESNAYQLQVCIPSSCLHGYDPAFFDRLGFTYRLNRPKKAPQHFAVSSRHYAIEQHPALWASLKLVK
ncbi:MAG: hypothetical protein ACM3JI_02055 [Anaerolineae bacterium]